MQKPIQLINLLLALALVVVCLLQWRRELRYRDEILNLDRLHQETGLKLVERDKKIRGLEEDAAGFKERITRMQAAMEEQELVLKTNRVRVERLESENAALKPALDTWKKAVADRDEALQQRNELLRKAAADRDEVVGRFNELVRKHNSLATNFNAVVERLNALQAAQTNATTGQGSSSPKP